MTRPDSKQVHSRAYPLQIGGEWEFYFLYQLRYKMSNFALLSVSVEIMRLL